MDEEEEEYKNEDDNQSIGDIYSINKIMANNNKDVSHSCSLDSSPDNRNSKDIKKHLSKNSSINLKFKSSIIENKGDTLNHN